MPILPINCFTHAGRSDLDQKFKDHLAAGIPEKEAARKVILDEHEKLFNDLNDLKKKINTKSKQEPYTPQDNSQQIKDINDQYDAKVKEAIPIPQQAETPQPANAEVNQTGKGAEIKPQSEKIKPVQDFKTMDLGKWEGTPEDDEAKKKFAEVLQAGDKKAGGNGETFDDFINRNIPAFDKSLREDPNNTTIITHSSNLKLLKTWEEMGRPEIDRITKGGDLHDKFAQEYLKQETQNGDLETFKGVKGDIHVIRHGETEDNKRNNFRSGNTNLTDQGIKDAHDAGKDLKKITEGDVPKIITSDLPRAIHTSNIIDDELGGRKTKPEDTGGIEKPPNKTGGVKEGEAEPSITGIQNSIVDKEREKRGMEPAMKVAKKEFGTVWDNAMKTIDENPNAGEELVRELKKKNRPLTDEENAILLHMQITLQTAYDRVNDNINKAAEKDDKAKMLENRVRLSALSDALQDVYNVGKGAGTLGARGLNSRKMLARENFTLASMETQKRAANNGRPLTEAEKSHLQELHDRIKELEDKVAKLEEEAKIPKPPKEKSKKTDKDFKEERKKIFDNISQKLKKLRGDTSATILPYARELTAIAPDVAKLVKSLVEQGVTKLDEIVKHIYENIKDAIPDIKKEDVKDIIIGKYDSPQLQKSLSPEQQKAKVELERNKMNFRMELEKDRRKNAGVLEKGLNGFVKWERAMKLSSPLTLAKLSMAAIYRTASSPIEEAIGGGISKILPKSITSKAYSEAGLNVKAEAKAFTDQFTKGMKDAWDTMNLKKGGRSELEVLYGKEGQLPPEAADFLGHLHGAIKAPIKRAAFTRSFEKRTANMIKAGIDTSDPLVATSIALDAYKDANRSIFMQDNAVSDWWQRHVVGDPKSDLGKIRSAVAQFLVPFAKVPTNIIGETGSYAGGLVIGGAKLANALIKGTENLKPEEADKIIRMFKKGSIGGAFLLLGYMNPQAIGGYYTGKRKEGDVGVGGMRLFGMDIPKWLVHNPLMEALQIGATVRRVKDSYIGKTDEHKGILEGMWEAGLGIGSEIPFVNSGTQLGKLFGTSQERNDYLGELIKNSTVPAIVQNVAQWTDNGAKRKPETILEHVKMGVPGLREQVSAKRGYTPEDLKKPSFSYFTDRGMSLPYASEKSVQIKDPSTNIIKHLSDYPQEKITEYYNLNKDNLDKKLGEIEKQGHVYVDRYGSISLDEAGSNKKRISLDDLRNKQLGQVLNLAERSSSESTKEKLFYHNKKYK